MWYWGSVKDPASCALIWLLSSPVQSVLTVRNDTDMSTVNYLIMHKHILHDMVKCLPKASFGIALRHAYKEYGCAYVVEKYIVAGRGAADEKLRARELCIMR